MNTSSRAASTCGSQILAAIVLAASAAHAQAPIEVEAPIQLRAGEILLEGTIEKIEADGSGLSLSATSFTLPSGKNSKLAAPKRKPIRIGADTQLFARGHPESRLVLSRLQPGWFIAAVGEDAGSGQPLVARTLAVWSRRRDGQYSLDLPEPIAAPDAQPQAEPVPQVVVAAIAPPRSSSAAARDDGAGSVLENGGFEDAEGLRIEGWTVPEGPAISVIEGEDNRYVLLKGIGDIQARKITHTEPLPIQPGWKTLKFSARVRGHDLRSGPEGWQNAHIEVTFQDAAGKDVGIASAIILAQDTDWVRVSGILSIPEGAVRTIIKAANFGLGGDFGLDDLHVVPNAPAEGIDVRAGFPEGGFEELDEQNRVHADAWVGLSAPAAQIVQEGPNHFLRLSLPKNGYVSVDCLVRIPNGARALQVQARMRAQDIKLGVQPWENARLGLGFADLKGSQAGGWTPALEVKADSDWAPLSQRIEVPPGAAFLKLSPSMLNTSGTLDVDDIQITAVP